MALNVQFHVCRVLFSKIFNPSLVSERKIKRYVSPTLRILKHREKEYLAETDPKTILERNRRSTFVEWNQEAEVYAFGKRLQEDFDLRFLHLAFTHKSYNIIQKEKMAQFNAENTEEEFKDNEDLAAEGEKIISNHVKNYISHFFPRFPLEGIQSIHDYLISDAVLAYISQNLGTTHIILSSDYPVEEATYSKTLKAIVGALKESQGTERAKLFVRDFIVTQLAGKDINDFLQIDNYFEVVCNILKRDGLQPPEPRIICQTATKSILANYHVGIYCDKQLLGHCSGETVETAIEMASLDVLKRFFNTTDSSSWIRYDAVLPPENQELMNNLPLCEWSASKFSKEKREEIIPEPGRIGVIQSNSEILNSSLKKNCKEAERELKARPKFR